MRLHRGLLLVALGTVLSVVVLRFSFRSISSSQAVAGCSPDPQADGSVDPHDTVAFWRNQPIPALTGLADSLTDKEKRVLGATSDEKWIEIDLSDQKMTAHQGSSVFLESLISSGLWGRTPPGEFRIWYKVRATKMEGGNKAAHTYYYLPNVPYVMFFNGAIGIHGTYWHQNFGTPMSHGCVNAPTPVSEKLFYWTDPQLPEGKLSIRSSPENPGTRVIVHE
ncbi:MAG: L,D-transpeptidase [bacterium]|nr:L,D-transpeptidase [bacterium]